MNWEILFLFFFSFLLGEKVILWNSYDNHGRLFFLCGRKKSVSFSVKRDAAVIYFAAISLKNKNCYLVSGRVKLISYIFDTSSDIQYFCRR